MEFKNIQGRAEIKDSICNFLTNFNDKSKDDISKPKGLFIYGPSGVGKTMMVSTILKELSMDSVWYNAGDTRSKSVLDNLTKQNMSDHNILSLFNKKKTNIVIVMDELEGMNAGDKGGLPHLLKLIRGKKTKKQKQEETISNPIICISGAKLDKKMKEFLKVCPSYYFPPCTEDEFNHVLTTYYGVDDEAVRLNIVNMCQNDLRKIDMLCGLSNNMMESKCEKNSECYSLNGISNVHLYGFKSAFTEIKDVLHNIYYNSMNVEQFNDIVNDNERTVLSLLWHENVIDIFKKHDDDDTLKLYISSLENICFADYVDRMTFQKQIWEFNELSSLIKAHHSSHMLINTNIEKRVLNADKIRFTKVLTKYSNEFNNMTLIQNVCDELQCDVYDMLSFVASVCIINEDKDIFFEECDVTELELNRIKRIIDVYLPYQ